ncbi:hypothetical protein [Streptomyces sp. NPDC001978]|uniref:hypothetical protein n=1 Tax=Streptomyces sp. NPDC001978 TaxID=3364627 RepID=UPI0036CAC145
MNADNHSAYLPSTTDTYDPADRLAKSVKTGNGAGRGWSWPCFRRWPLPRAAVRSRSSSRMPFRARRTPM